MQVFNRELIEKQILLDTEIVQVIEKAFAKLATRNVSQPPIMRIDIPENNGEFDIKSAFVEGDTTCAIKVSSGFFENWKIGLPSGGGLMMLMDAVTGTPKALLLDHGYLTDIRTAAAGAVAAKYLANQKIKTAGVIGCGNQAFLQLKALKLVRSFNHVLIAGRSEEKVSAFINRVEKELGVSAGRLEYQGVVENSDVIITATPSQEPLIQKDWLRPGQHITAMGSDAEHKQELSTEVIAAADLFACDVLTQSLRLGELRNVNDREIIERTVELGRIISGEENGRTNTQQITICDLSGTGIQDTAIAQYAEKLLSGSVSSHT